MNATTTPATETNLTANVQALCALVNERSGLNYRDYVDPTMPRKEDVAAFRADQRKIAQDRKDFYELLSVAWRRMPADLDARVKEELVRGERLQLEDGKAVYHEGQMWATEYREACCRLIASLVWYDFREEKNAAGELVYARDGAEKMRKAIRRTVSRRVGLKYFN